MGSPYSHRANQVHWSLMCIWCLQFMSRPSDLPSKWLFDCQGPDSAVSLSSDCGSVSDIEIDGDSCVSTSTPIDMTSGFEDSDSGDCLSSSSSGSYGDVQHTPACYHFMCDEPIFFCLTELEAGPEAPSEYCLLRSLPLHHQCASCGPLPPPCGDNCPCPTCSACTTDGRPQLS